MPELPRPETKAEKFGEDVRLRLDDVLKRLRELREEMAKIRDERGPRKSDLAHVVKELEGLEMQLVNNLPFIASQFNENMEESLLAARQEMEMYFSQRIREIGLDAASERAPMSLPGSEDQGEPQRIAGPQTIRARVRGDIGPKEYID